ncbi:MAG: outer membrane protein OmpA [Segetibacter sp.]|nr:outer membrane protein OmpA [Segetibacter sp.]
MHEQLSISKQHESAPAVALVLPAMDTVEQDLYIKSLERFPLQPKLSIGAVDDPLEDEADAMADKVMRTTEPSFIQRKCDHCQEEEKLQRKPSISFIKRKGIEGSPVATGSIENKIESSKGVGSPLPAPTKSFMESRFDTDFSNVRIHTGPYATEMSKELNAQAFTVANDIYFNAGKFSPGSSHGKHLLAHELTHTIQQRSTDISRRIQRVCPPRQHNETARSATLPGILPVNVILSTADNSLIIQDFAVGSSALPPNVLNNPDWQRTMSIVAGTPSMNVAMQGHTDCAGSAAENLSLREQRVATVLSVMPVAARAKVVPFLLYTTAQVYLTANDTAESRAGNRAVRIMFRAADPTGDCDTIGRAANLDQYIFMVTCVQNRLHLTASADTRRLISVLRQIYYGNAPWSGSRNSVWNNVITDRPWNAGTDPSSLLGSHLFNALQTSQVVEGVDIGHLLTGIDAMFNPHNVEIPFGPITSVTNIINEEWATWAGDVGSSVGEWAIETMYAGRDQDLDTFFSRFAGNSDLWGNIESFAIRLGINGGTAAGQLGRAFVPGQTFSEILMNAFRITSSAAGRRNQSRVRDFVEAYGGITSSNAITNQPALVNRLKPAIREFAQLYSMDRLLRRGYFGGGSSQPTGSFIPYLDRGIDEMTQRFVNWLQQHL